MCYRGCSNRLHHRSARMRGTGGSRQNRQGYRSRFRLFQQIWYLQVSCRICAVVSPQKQQRSPSEAQQRRCLPPGRPGSHRLWVRLPPPPRGGLAALPATEGPPQLSRQLYWQDGSTWPQGDPRHWSRPSSQRATRVGDLADRCVPSSCSPPEGMAGSPSSHLVGWNRVLVCGQARGEALGQVPRDIRAVSTRRGLMWCDTNIRTEHPKRRG